MCAKVCLECLSNELFRLDFPKYTCECYSFNTLEILFGSSFQQSAAFSYKRAFPLLELAVKIKLCKHEQLTVETVQENDHCKILTAIEGT